MIRDFFDLKPIMMPTDAWKDHKRLSKFLFSVHDTVNRLVKDC